MLEIEDVSTLHPDGFSDDGEGAGKRIGVGRACPFRVGLTHRPYANRLNDEVAKFLSLVRRRQQSCVLRIESEEDVRSSSAS